MPAKLTQEQVIERIEKKQEGQYEVIGMYTTKSDPIKIRCRNCGLEWSCDANSLFRNRIGKECKHHINLTQEIAEKRILNASNGNISLIAKYEGAKIPAMMYCKTCDYKWKTEPYVIYGMNMGCPRCSGKVTRTTEQYRHEVRDIVGDEYVVLGEYTKSHDPIEMKHVLCGKHFYPSPKNFLFSGTRCPRCRESKGEKEIRAYLEGHSIEYKEQFWFDDCRYKNPLPFDFAVFKENEIECLIEFQGVQHYKSGWFDRHGDQFELRKLRDGIKRKYCENNNIDLITIPCKKISASIKQIHELVNTYLDDYFVTSQD